MTPEEVRNQKLKKELIEDRRKRVEEILYETIPSSLVTLDKNFQIIDCNKIFVDSVGYSKDEIVGKVGFDFINEEDKKMILSNMEEIKKGKTIRHDLHIKRKNGSIFHALWNTIAIFDENKKYDGHFSIGFELTEMDELREELIKTEKITTLMKLKEIQRKKTEKVLYETIPNPIVTFDQNNKFVDCNQRFLDKMGFSKDEICRMYAPDFLIEEDKKIFQDVISYTLNEGEKLMEIDLHVKKKDGSIFHSLWSHIRLEDDNNEYLGFTAIGLDLTEIDKLRDKLIMKEKFEILGQIASNLAHDLKNPLASMQQSLEIIQMKTKDDEIAMKESQRASRVIKRIEHQVDEVLTYIKKPLLTTKDTTILTILHQSLEMLSIPDKISVEFLVENDFDVKWDEVKISDLFTNIILNAVQAIGKDEGKISIRVTQENSTIKIEIENSGPNIPEEDLDKIFEPLYTTKMQGTGLGLSGCKNIVESHHGTITASSNPVKFTIKIPKFL